MPDVGDAKFKICCTIINSFPSVANIFINLKTGILIEVPKEAYKLYI